MRHLEYLVYNREKSNPKKRVKVKPRFTWGTRNKYKRTLPDGVQADFSRVFSYCKTEIINVIDYLEKKNEMYPFHFLRLF